MYIMILLLSHCSTVFEDNLVYSLLIGDTLATRLNKAIFKKGKDFFTNMYLFQRLRSPHDMAEV